MTEPLLFRFLTADGLILFVAHRAYYTRKYPPQKNEAVDQFEGSTLSRLAAVLAIVAFVAGLLYIFATSLIDWAAQPFPLPVRWFGVVMAVAGFVLLEWAHRALSANWSDQPRITEQQELVRAGPYWWIRHPMYTASFSSWDQRCFSLRTGWSESPGWRWSASMAWRASGIKSRHSTINSGRPSININAPLAACCPGRSQIFSMVFKK